jgi:hypothetical protein
MVKNLNFIPVSKHEARETIKNLDGGLYNDEYDLKREHEKVDAERKKNARLYGDFKVSYYNDNGSKVDASGLDHNIK